MATISKNDCVNTLRQQTGMSTDEAQRIVEEMLLEKERLKGGGQLSPQSLARRWASKAELDLHKKQVQRWRAYQSLLRYHEQTAAIDRIKAEGGTPLQALHAILTGISARFGGVRDSVSALRQGIFRSWSSGLLRELEAVDGGAAMKLLREDKNFHDDVLIEMREPNSTGNKNARQVADIFGRYMEQSRQALNAWGADIGHLKGWTPQTHSAEKMMAGPNAREEWIQFISRRLDTDKSFGTTDPAQVRKALESVYDTLTIGKDPKAPKTAVPGGSGTITARLEHSRVLQFKDARSALEYHDQYGNGNIFDAMVRQLDREARTLSLLQKLGPNPQLLLERLVARERHLIHNNDKLTQEQKKQMDEQLAHAIQKGTLTGGRLLHKLAELEGETNFLGGNRRFAGIMATIRAIETLSKLGGASLSAIADVFVKAANMRVNGVTWPEAIQKSMLQYYESYGPRKTEVARQVGDFLDHLNMDIAARWDDALGMPGVLADMQDKMFRWTGLNWITERGKAGYSMWLSNHIAEAAGQTWDNLGKDLRAMLEYHGVDEKRWTLMRGMVQHCDENGLDYFIPETALRLSDADIDALVPDWALRPETKPEVLAAERQKAREKLQFDSMAMIVDETGFAIIEPDDATRSVLRMGTRRGTVAGEFWRAGMQFKSFPIAYMQRILGGRRWVRGNRQAGMRYGRTLREVPGAIGDALGKDIPGLVGFVLSSVAFGYAAMVAKDISKGRDPRSPLKMETWLAAIVQSGGAGIIGDFLFGKVNRFGNSLGDTVIGPTGELVNKGFTVAGQLVRGEFENAGEDALRTLTANTPFINMWYTRAALDWLLLYHIQEMLSPGSLARMERKMKQEYNQSYLVSPSENIKRGGGWG